MERVKILVKTEEEVEIAYKFFENKGFKKESWCKNFRLPFFVCNWMNKDMEFSNYSTKDSGLFYVKELTIDEIKSTNQKEYLQKLTDGSYKLVVLSDVVDGHDGLIEVPDGANYAYKTSGGSHIFFKDESNETSVGKEWYKGSLSRGYFISSTSAIFLWKRDEEVVKSYVDVTLDERKSQYGSFKDVAGTTQKLMSLLQPKGCTCVQQEALHMICSKLARITHGDVNHVDSWHDIAGYATLVVNELENK